MADNTPYRAGHDVAITETWQVSKPAVSGTGGVVVSQHYGASAVGAEVLSRGGNAIDAALATGFALGVLEPWMSGIGGCGNLLYYDAKADKGHAISFGVRAPFGLDANDYPLAGGNASDLFAWPAVEGDRNVHGPMSVAVPGYVAGASRALERFGTRSFAETIAPAIEIARDGMAVDWYASLKIASSAKTLAQHASSSSVYLDAGHTPIGEWGGPLPRITLTGLAQTLDALAKNGPDDFYHGEVAAAIVRDAEACGIGVSAADLAEYFVTEEDAVTSNYNDHRVLTVPRMTAGPTLNHALDLLRPATGGASEAEPSVERYVAFATALYEAYEHRLNHMGDANESSSPSCTSHLSVVDRDGNCVSLTQTLLSLFGSKIVLPGTGILMNNGIMWFDPRPGRANSMAAGGWPLSNMCPTVLRSAGDASGAQAKTVALGASGGRRIMPAVFQVLSFLADNAMTLSQAAHHPRIDVSGSNNLSVDERLPSEVAERLRSAIAGANVTTAPNGVYPALFACPNIAAYHDATGVAEGAAFVASPWAKAEAVDH